MKKKTLALVLALTLLVAGVVGGTLAWLTDQTAEVKNTFTVGDINIGLTETTADYMMVPGNTIAKDPTINVAQGSQTAYTFMKVQLSDDFRKLIKDWATAQKVSDPKEMISAWFSSTVKPKIMAADIEKGYVILGVLSP